MFRKSNILGSSILRREHVKQIVSYTRERENITTIWLPGGGRSSAGIKLQNTSFLQDNTISRRVSRTKFYYVDLNLNPLQIENYIDETLGQNSDKNGIRPKIEEIIKNRHCIYFVLDNISTSNADNLKYVLSLKSINDQKVKFLNMFNAKNFLEVRKRGETLPSSLFQNIILVPYLNRNEAIEWMGNAARKMRLRLSLIKKNRIYNFAGGIPVLMKNSMRAYKFNENLDATFNSFQLKNIIDTYWNSFDDVEKQILYAAATRQPIPNHPKKVSYLRDLELLETNNRLTKEWIRHVEFQQS